MTSEIKSLFTREELARFSVQRNHINVIALIFLYLLSFGIIYFYSQFGSALYIVIGFLIMGAIQHTLATFVHEAAHLNLFTNKKMNDFFGHLLCAAPLISYLKDYRYFHFEHHRHTGKVDKDPELKFYRAMGIRPEYSSRTEVLQVFLNDLTGISYFKGLLYVLKFFGEKRKEGAIDKPTLVDHVCIMGWLTAVPFIAWKAGLLVPFVIFWLLPIITLTPLLLRWHGFGEHIREKNVCQTDNTLTHQFGIIPTLFLYPINSSFHLEHHLYPQIPWYELRNFYKWAIQNEVYKECSMRLTVNGFFVGEKTVLKLAFPIKK